MTNFKTSIKLSDIKGISDIAEEVRGEALEPGDHDVMVEQLPSGEYEILDGMHRVSGYIASGADMDDEVTVIVVGDQRLAGLVADGFDPDQDDYIEEIIESLED